MSKREGGPAFPCEAVEEEFEGKVQQVVYTGMTLRDYFAGQFILGLMEASFSSDEKFSPQIFCERAYKMADLMLAERDK